MDQQTCFAVLLFRSKQSSASIESNSKYCDAAEIFIGEHSYPTLKIRRDPFFRMKDSFDTDAMIFRYRQAKFSATGQRLNLDDIFQMNAPTIRQR